MKTNRYVIRHTWAGRRIRSYFSNKRNARKFASTWGLPQSQIKVNA